MSKFDSNLFIRIYDEDGEFLLIESALYLDKWAQEPRYTENRVYIFGGDLHLVSPKFIKNQYDNLSNFIQECVNFISNNPNKTRCKDSVQDCINQRIGLYPENVNKTHHNAHCNVPIRVALMLQQNPELISSAIRAFYYRTPDDIKIINSMEHFKLEKWILTNVRFNRCLFAQLTSQEFIPNSKTISLPITNSNIYKNGLKITAGFEILVSNFEKNSSKTNSSNDLFEKNNHLTGKYIYECLKNLEPIPDCLMTNPLPLPDDENWLNIDSDQLEALLSEKFNSNEPLQGENKDYSKTIPETLFKFMDKDAGLDGAEFDSDDFESENEWDFQSESDDSDNFENETKSEPSKLDNQINAYMKQMDSELAKTILSKSFAKVSDDEDDDDDDNDNDDNDNKNEIDINFNAFSNIIKSVQEEIDTPQSIGPATTMFAFMKQKLPDFQNEDNLK